MNYFAHGMRFIDRPYFLAGTAIPDWLSVVDRRVRMRPRRVAQFIDESESTAADVAGGVMQHLDDDRWFHKTRGFLETTTELAGLFRDLLGGDGGYRPGFLGHVTTELLLDGVLMAADARRVDDYYAALSRVDPVQVQTAVNRMARHRTAHLAPMIPLFVREQFLRDYLEPPRLLYRLNQVMRRIKLKQLPRETESLLVRGWAIVEGRVDDLLPPESFSEPGESNPAVSGQRRTLIRTKSPGSARFSPPD